ncbi:MAG: hypothetical protein IPO32_17985 [Crocinitomicaceae bacterium]|nr:hypothetical protein [Crocinitomicaceae bacterium]
MDGLGNNLVLDIDEDADGNLWFATAGGISKFDGKTFTNYTTAQGLSHNFATSIMFDHNGDLWIATDGGGINKFHGNQQKGFTHYTVNEGMPSNNINVILKTPMKISGSERSKMEFVFLMVIRSSPTQLPKV